MRSGNPALNSKAFERFDVFEPTQAMTIEGTTIKTGFLLVLAAITAAFTWVQFTNGGPAAMPLMWGGAIGGLVLAIATIFKPTWAPVTAPGYAMAEGLFLGGISAMYNSFYDGIVFQAVVLTFTTLLSMLIVYRAGWVRATEKFKAGVFAATGAIFFCLPDFNGHGDVWSRGSVHPRFGSDRHRFQLVRGGDRRTEPGARFRLHRAGSRPSGAEVHGMVRCVRIDGDARLALPRNSATPVKTQQTWLARNVHGVDGAVCCRGRPLWRPG